MSKNEMIMLPRDLVGAVIAIITDSEKSAGQQFIKECWAVEILVDAMKQPDPAPYLWYDPENGDTWTQDAVDEGFCVTDNLIPLYENQSNTKEEK